MDFKYCLSYCCDRNKELTSYNDFSNYIWTHYSASWSEKMIKLEECYEDHCLFTGGLGGIMLGSVYIFSKNEILDLIEANKEWFNDFDCDEMLKTEYYYLVVEDWS